ncbi:hypothetical protein WICPIJ_000880 [Wickerhamomyces pijperi]|uniref:Phospholipid-transporting ATPase n=1 Tax=Wickerhamomyces pijperi TaxID=599730 RepID=A0A9P8QF19_WICPI|nr:hypothetical protein WICPIJ_000880 [Wickerhamomyces pijperi]
MSGNLDVYQYLLKKFSKPKILTERTVFFNQELPSEFINHKTKQPLNVFDSNNIRTTKYTPFSFIPKNLLFQFSNIANVYFLVLIILGAFQIFGVQSPGLAAVPLIVIVCITAIKDAIEDSRRTISDLELNNNPISILNGVTNHNVAQQDTSFKAKFNDFNANLFVNFVSLFDRKKSLVKSIEASRGSFETINSERLSLDEQSLASQPQHHNNDIPSNIAKMISRNHQQQQQSKKFKFAKHSWKDLKVGDIVRLHNNEECPADLIILSTSDEDKKCFVETKNLDGETNLKPRKSMDLTCGVNKSKDLELLQFKVRSEAPNTDMYHYRGSLVVDGESGEQEEPVNIENLILRGSSLRNTKWVIGFVLFTGHESKIMLNSGVTPTKKSQISRELNLSVVINFAVLFILCLVSGIINGVFYDKKDTSFIFFEYNSYGGTPAKNGIISFFVAMILYQALVPISLYISVEIIKTLQAMFIYHDVKMYYEPLDYPCTPKTWNISDDLGQIEYIFSDKTGTLTQNVMEFRKATVNGKQYGLAYTEAQAGMDKRKGVDIVAAGKHWEETISADKEQMVQLLNSGEYPVNPQFNPDSLTFISSEFVKDMLNESSSQSAKNKEFLLYLALCHTALTEEVIEEPENEGDEPITRLEFKAESPDEAALVQVASDLGFVFTRRTRKGCIVNTQGQDVEFEVLSTLEFNSARKRMSVVVRFAGTKEHPRGKLMLITKGADSMIYSRLSTVNNNKQLLEATAENLEEFANEGLRTLCVAGRELDESEYQQWAQRYARASNELENREELMEQVASELESELVLYGGTAIEDRLQVGVPESIEKLGRAGIKLWILTGDKIETAINIGFSCNLLGNEMELLVLKQGNENIEGTLTEYLSRFNLKGDADDLIVAQKDHSLPTSNTAIIVDGFTLAEIFADESQSLKIKFLLLCKQCKSVICCRVSPSQKAQVVQLVRESLQVMTLAIGDGANDVAMIQTANVGVGIVGEEGRQAAMSSDYAIGQFKYLERLVLVHGRWDYKRLAEMVPLFFYKNVCFTLTLFWYGIFTNFDGSYLLEFTMITFYNLAFTSLPVIFLGILDQDVEDTVALKFPQLYKTGILRLEWSQYKFLYYMADGLYQSAVSFFFPYLVFHNAAFATSSGLSLDHRFWIGTFATHISVTSVDLYVLMRQYRWDWVSLLVNALSILVVFFWCGIYSSFISSSEFYKSAAEVYGSASFWACFFVGVVVNLAPRLVFDTLKVVYHPKDIDVIRACVVSGQLNDQELALSEDSSLSEDEKLASNLKTETGFIRPPRISYDSQRLSSERIRPSLDLPELSQARSLVHSLGQTKSSNA